MRQARAASRPTRHPTRPTDPSHTCYLSCTATPRPENQRVYGQCRRERPLRSEGKIFGSGVLLVGTEVKAGTYYTTDVKGCCWERTDSNGQIIDNYFTNAAKRVQVTLRAGDYSFNSEHRGEWKPLGE